LDRDKKRVAEAAAKQQLEEKIKGAYDAVRELEAAYIDSVYSIWKEQDNYSKAFEQNKLGLLSFAELEAARMAVIGAEQSALSNLINYNKFIHTLNFYTVGGMQNRLGLLDFYSGVYEAGDSIPIVEETEVKEQDKKSDKPTWTIEVPYTEYRFSFGIYLPSKIEATHFQLELEDGRKVGPKTEVKKRLEHMPILFSDSSILRLKLYKDKNLVYEALIDGSDYAGTLELKPVDQSAKIDGLSGQSIGTFKIIENKSTGLSSLFISPGEAFGADAYAFIDASGDLEKFTPVIKKLDEEIIGLGFVLKDFEGYLLQFYQGDNPVFTGKLKPGESGSEGELVVNASNKSDAGGD